MLATDALLEKSAGLALGCVVAACGAGAVPAAFAGAAVAGAGLAGLLHKTFSAKGLDSKAAIAAVRRRTRDRLAREAVRSITPSDVHLIEAADRALALHLDSCFPNRDALVEHTFDPDGFPTRVSALVLKELEARSPEFFSDRAPTFAVSFARTVVESSLRAALETPEYFALLQPHLVTALHQRIARIERTLAEGLRINAEADAKTHELLHAMMARLDASGAMVQAQAQGLSEKQITALLTRFGHLGVPLEQAERLLLKAADELTELRARLSTLRNDEPEVSVKRAAAVAAMDASDFATADELLAEAEALDLASGEMRILRAAEIRSQRADLARSQLRLLDAADHYAEAARLAAPFDLMEARSAAWSEAMTCREHAELFGGTNSIDRAVGVLRRELDGLNFGAMVLVADSIATLLMMRSDRSGDAGVAEIRGAVDLYVKIYSQFQAGEFPDLQQRVLCGLGVAQHKLGRRLLFRDGLPILQQSAETFRLAIRIMDAHKNWEHRRTALSGLGSVLTTLGEKLEPATSLPILVESLSVLGANAASIDRIIEPNAWASAVGRLGVAEMSLGSKTSGPQGLSLLLSAARCHEEALGVLQRDSQAAKLGPCSVPSRCISAQHCRAGQCRVASTVPYRRCKRLRAIARGSNPRGLARRLGPDSE